MQTKETTMSDPIRKVYEKWHDKLPNRQYVPPNRQDQYEKCQYIQDSWASIRAHVEAERQQCVWIIDGEWSYPPCESKAVKTVVLADARWCQYCGAPLVRKETTGE